MEQIDGAESEPAGRKPARIWRRLFLTAGCLGLAWVGTEMVTQVQDALDTQITHTMIKAKADLQALSDAVERYAIEDGHYPTSLVPLVTPDENGFRIIPLDSVPRDPWGREYLYVPPTPGSESFEVRTLGSDGRPGGRGEARDLDNLAIRSGKI